jgi:hypothetical protein
MFFNMFAEIFVTNVEFDAGKVSNVMILIILYNRGK